MARDAFCIEPSDAVDLTAACDAIYVGEGGTLVVRERGSPRDVTIAGVRSGAIIPLPVVAVRASGTTACNIVGLTLRPAPPISCSLVGLRDVEV